jgi:hypothetical protein
MLTEREKRYLLRGFIHFDSVMDLFVVTFADLYFVLIFHTLGNAICA